MLGRPSPVYAKTCKKDILEEGRISEEDGTFSLKTFFFFFFFFFFCLHTVPINESTKYFRKYVRYHSFLSVLLFCLVLPDPEPSMQFVP